MPTSQIPNTTNKTLSTTHPPPTLPEPLPCPRCDSTNTKFCYYNNYNLSQPRHFCKSCRRYWTHGGSLRNIPVGGSTRKAVKPRRASSSSATSTVTTATTTSSSTTSTSRLSIEAPPQPPENCLNLNENMHESDQNASFMSLLSSQVAVPGFGFGSSLGFGLCEMGIGVNWPYNVGNDHNGGGDTWQVSDHQEGMSKDDGNNGLVVDEESCGYFGWPELAIATPGTSLK